MSRAPFLRVRARRVALIVGGAAASALVAQTAFGAFGSAAALRASHVSRAPLRLRPTISTRATLALSRASDLPDKCSFDHAGYLSCPSPVIFTGSSRTRRGFGVRARNTTGVTRDVTPYSWRGVRPWAARAPFLLHPRLTTAPVRPWISRNATFAWLLERSETSECRLDAGVWTPCASPKTYLGLRLGAHVFRVRARSANGRPSGVNRFGWTIVSSVPPAAPAITSRPDADTTSTDAVFGFDVAAGSSFECRLDPSGWQQCSKPAIYVGLGSGRHTFCVHAIGPGGVVGPETCVNWMVHSPAIPSPEPSGAFTISGNLSSLLAPGAGGPLPLTVSNPFDFDLKVTGLTVTVRPGSSLPGCDGPANLQVTQSNTAGGSVLIVVPAHGSVILPAQGATAPQVTMLDLATNQDACKNAVFTFSFAGTGTST